MLRITRELRIFISTPHHAHSAHQSEICVKTWECPHGETRLVMIVPGCVLDFWLLSLTLWSPYFVLISTFSHPQHLIFIYLLYFGQDSFILTRWCWEPPNWHIQWLSLSGLSLSHPVSTEQTFTCFPWLPRMELKTKGKARARLIQLPGHTAWEASVWCLAQLTLLQSWDLGRFVLSLYPVYYTHLTLTTIRLV